MPTLTENDAIPWSRWITDFDGTYNLFAQNFSALKSLAPYVQARHPELLAQYNALVAKGAQHEVTLSALKKTRDQVAGWLNSIGSAIANAESATIDWLKQRFGLGAIPILVVAISIGAAAASLAVIAVWITDAFKMSQKLNALYTLEGQGKTPEAAAKIVATTLGLGGGIPWRWLVVGAIALVFGPPLLKAIGGRRG